MTAVALIAMSRDRRGFREVKGQGRISGFWGFQGSQEGEVLPGALGDVTLELGEAAFLGLLQQG